MKTTRLSALLLSSGLVFHCVGQSFNCERVLDPAEVEVSSVQDIHDATTQFMSAHSSEFKGIKGSGSFGIVLPPPAPPIPINASGSAESIRNNIQASVQQYSREYNFHLAEHSKIRFIMPGQVQAWLECKKLEFRSRSVEFQYDYPTVFGKHVSFTVSLDHNALPATIQACRIISDGATHEVDSLRNKIFESGKKMTIVWDVQSTSSDFYLELITDRYAPVIVQIPVLSPVLSGTSRIDSLFNSRTTSAYGDRILTTSDSKRISLKANDRVLLHLVYEVQAYVGTDACRKFEREEDGWKCDSACVNVYSGAEVVATHYVRRQVDNIPGRQHVDKGNFWIPYLVSRDGDYSFDFTYSIQAICDGGGSGRRPEAQWLKLFLTVSK